MKKKYSTLMGINLNIPHFEKHNDYFCDNVRAKKIENFQNYKIFDVLIWDDKNNNFARRPELFG